MPTTEQLASVGGLSDKTGRARRRGQDRAATEPAAGGPGTASPRSPRTSPRRSSRRRRSTPTSPTAPRASQYSLSTVTGNSGARWSTSDNKQGYCEQYAAAMAVMLRVAGHPVPGGDRLHPRPAAATTAATRSPPRTRTPGSRPTSPAPAGPTSTRRRWPTAGPSPRPTRRGRRRRRRRPRPRAPGRPGRRGRPATSWPRRSRTRASRPLTRRRGPADPAAGAGGRRRAGRLLLLPPRRWSGCRPGAGGCGRRPGRTRRPPPGRPGTRCSARPPTTGCRRRGPRRRAGSPAGSARTCPWTRRRPAGCGCWRWPRSGRGTRPGPGCPATWPERSGRCGAGCGRRRAPAPVAGGAAAAVDRAACGPGRRCGPRTRPRR